MTNTNAYIAQANGLTPADFTIKFFPSIITGTAQYYVECQTRDSDGDRTWGHFPTEFEAKQFILLVTGVSIYVDQWGIAYAEVSGVEEDGTLVSPAPFGDNTFRVIDEREGGVVAYFGTEDAAQAYANFLIEQAI